MTNENGVITGMPPKATVAAGVTINPNTLVTAIKSSNASLSSIARSSATQSGFSSSSSTTSASLQQGAAAPRTIAGSATILAVIAMVAALL